MQASASETYSATARYKTFVIAEAGVNHNGSFVDALKLVDTAVACGANAVKFQCFSATALRRPELKPLELRFYQFEEIAAYCKQIGIEFLCTPFDVEAVAMLAPLVRRMKVASGCLANTALLEAIRDTQRPAILSTGMNTLFDVAKAYNVLARYHKPTLLHCTSAYPAPIESVNLKAMTSLRQKFNCDVGYSDHTLGITVPIAAVALGATVIEKHLTLDRNATGPDHKASIEPREFRVMVSAIRTVETALGDGIKRVQDCERDTRRIWYGA